jgi:hypothetical protein
MLLRTKVAALVAIPALALIAPAALSATAAQASVAAPAQASGAGARLAAWHGAQVVVPDALGKKICQGDVCIQSQNAGALQENIRAWANTYGFKGHFEMQFGCSPGICNTINSNNQYWRAGGTGYTFDGIPSGVGACVTAWNGPFDTGSRWRSIGDVCFEVGGY